MFSQHHLFETYIFDISAGPFFCFLFFSIEEMAKKGEEYKNAKDKCLGAFKDHFELVVCKLYTYKS